MTEEPPPRVRVTGPRRRQGPRMRTGDIDEETPLGGVYLRSLLRDQFLLALRTVALLVLSIGSLPALFHFFPGLVDVRPGGLPLPWLLMGVAVYPVLVLLGWSYVRRAERNERHFAELLTEDFPTESGARDRGDRHEP